MKLNLNDITVINNLYLVKIGDALLWLGDEDDDIDDDTKEWFECVDLYLNIVTRQKVGINESECFYTGICHEKEYKDLKGGKKHRKIRRRKLMHEWPKIDDDLPF